MGESRKIDFGYQCPVRGCKQKNNRRFNSLSGLLQHMELFHPGEAEKRLRAKKSKRTTGKNLW